MCDFETTAPVGREAERVITAFYRFLELRSAPADADVRVRSEVAGDVQHCVIRLWSDAAVDDFRGYLRTFQTPKPGGLLREFGAAS
ncbi:MAG TPA: hypothetical protein VMU59_10795 [Caulobacteraceae bacterium]|nr:hypothetical protein [Caulobacteraceae bacterium]